MGAADWPVASNGELVSALDGNWSAYEREIAGKIDGKAKKGGGCSVAGQLRQATLIPSVR